MTSLLKKWNIPGAAIAVVKDGKLILARGYGYADFEAKQLMQPDSMFRIGSISKVLTSMAILHLKDQGQLDLDAKFLDILTDYHVTSGGDSRLRNITIRHLLQHSGGWDRDTTGDPMRWQGTISRALNIPMPVLCPDIIRYMMSQPLDFAPGSKQVYSNLGFCILGRVVEKVSGEPYELYVRNHVLAPMDVHAMSIGYSHLSQRGPHEVKYYDYDGAPLIDSVFPGEGKVPSTYGMEILTLDSCGGWIGSPIDLTRVMSAIDGSRMSSYLTTQTMAEFLADPGIPDWYTTPNYWYGLGIQVGPTPQTWSHGGAIAGARSELMRDEDGYIWAILTNSLSRDAGKLGVDFDVDMEQALDTGLEGSPTDLYLDYPSPDLPARHQ
jgi:N-acyl-D-amino-acid deacylase